MQKSFILVQYTSKIAKSVFLFKKSNTEFSAKFERIVWLINNVFVVSTLSEEKWQFSLNTGSITFRFRKKHLNKNPRFSLCWRKQQRRYDVLRSLDTSAGRLGRIPGLKLWSVLGIPLLYNMHSFCSCPVGSVLSCFSCRGRNQRAPILSGNPPPPL